MAKGFGGNDLYKNSSLNIKKQKMKKAILFLMILIGGGSAVLAQTLSSDVTTQYPANVIVRVHDVVFKVGLSDNKQLLLAKHFKIEDSLLKVMITANASTTAIDSFKKISEADFQSILGSAKSNDYYAEKYRNQSSQLGKVSAAMIRERYNCDTAISNKLEKLYTQKQLFLNKAFFSNFSDSATLYNRLHSVTATYDSLIDKYTYTASSNWFIDERIVFLNSIKPLGPVSSVLKNKFLALCHSNRERGFGENFTQAMHKSTNDTTYYKEIFKDEILSKATINASSTIRKLKKHKKVTPDGIIALYPVLLQKEKQIAVIGFAYSNRRTIDSLISIINDSYDSLEIAILQREPLGLSNSQFAIAVRYRSTLGLSNIQVDSLTNKARQLKQMKEDFLESEPFGKYDSKAFETANMLTIVSEEQYMQVLKIKNKTQAENDAKQDWDELVQRGLVTTQNRDTTIKKLKNYYLAKWCAYYRYGNDKIMQTANVKAIESSMPGALRVLRAARKQNNSVTGNGAQYQW